MPFFRHPWVGFGFLCCATLCLLGGSAEAEPQLYGRLNVSLERRDFGGPSQTAIEDNNSRIGLIESEAIAPGVEAGVHLEMGFDATTGATAGRGFDRGAELFIGSPKLRLSVGSFGSTAYLNITDIVSLHNHDTGISADALFAHVEPLARKIGVSMSTAGLTLQLVNWRANPLYPGSAGTAAMLGYEKAGMAFAVSSGRDQRGRYEHSARMLLDLGPFIFATYIEKDRNVYGAGTRLLKRIALAWRSGSSEWHMNVGSAGGYSGGLPGESSARQVTAAYNYNLSARTKIYALATQVHDHGRLYGNVKATGIGLRQNF
jgi:hypothetical protein